MRRPGTERPVSRLAAMPGRIQITLLACLCAAILTGCGSDEQGTIPNSNSEQLMGLLDGIEENVAGGNCELAQEQANEFVDAVNQLPAEVDDEVKGGLQDAAAQLVELSNDRSECEDTTGETGFDELEPTTTTTTPTTTETTTTETEEEPEEDEEQQQGQPQGPPEGQGGGQGGGPPVSPPGGGGGEGTVTIEPPSEEDPTSGGIGGDKGPRR
jgi:hypothetical protein